MWICIQGLTKCDNQNTGHHDSAILLDEQTKILLIYEYWTGQEFKNIFRINIYGRNKKRLETHSKIKKYSPVVLTYWDALYPKILKKVVTYDV